MIYCDNANCKYNTINSLIGHRICDHDLIEIDAVGVCKEYTSIFNCIKCGCEINYNNSRIGEFADVCHECYKEL